MPVFTPPVSPTEDEQYPTYKYSRPKRKTKKPELYVPFLQENTKRMKKKKKKKKKETHKYQPRYSIRRKDIVNYKDCRSREFYLGKYEFSNDASKQKKLLKKECRDLFNKSVVHSKYIFLDRNNQTHKRFRAVIDKGYIYPDLVVENEYGYNPKKSMTRVGLGEGVKVPRNKRGIKKGEIIGAYYGKIILNDEESIRNNYYMEISHKFVIDARNYGNITRFINDSKTPNLDIVIVYDKKTGLMYFCFRAKQDIKPGDFLHFDYGSSYFRSLGIERLTPIS